MFLKAMAVTTSFLFLCVLSSAQEPTAAAANKIKMKPASMEELFIEPGKPATLHFSSEGVETPDNLEFQISNYPGTEAGKGKLQWDANEKSYSTQLQLEKGYYEIFVPVAKQTFGIVALAPYEGKRDAFFAIEEVFNSRTLKDGPRGLNVLKRSGIGCTREWYQWSGVEKIEGQPDLREEIMYDAIAKEGLKAVPCFSRGPDWTGRIPPKARDEKSEQPYPKHLLRVENSIVAMQKRWEPALAAFQVMNEPDLTGVPGDAVMPIIEACSWFFAKRNIKTPLAGAPFSSWDTSKACLSPYFESGMLDYIDIFAFHTYHQPEMVIPLVKTYREAMKSHPKAAMPIWITESGKPWACGLKTVLTTYGGPEGKHRALPEEDKTSALWITMKGVEAKAGGIDRYFPFTMYFMRENTINYGMMDYDKTPHRSMAAYVHCVQALSNKDYIGDLKSKALPANVKIARVFSDGRNAVAVLYTGETAPKKTNLKQLPAVEACAMDGRALTLDKNGSLEIDGGIAYIQLDQSKISEVIDSNTEAMALLKLAKSYKPIPRKASPAVFQFAHWNIKEKDLHSYHGCPESIEVNAFNLSDSEVKISPELILPEGGEITKASFPGTELTLKPRSSTALLWTLDLKKCANAEQPITLRDRKGQAAPIMLPFRVLEKAKAKSFEFDNPARWRSFVSPGGEMTISRDEAEKALKIHADFPKDDKNSWVYPEYALNLPEESLDGAIAVSFEIRMKQGNGLTRLKHSTFQLNYDSSSKKAYYGKEYKDPTGEWQRRIVAIPADKLPGANTIRIGMNPNSDTLDYWIRDLKILYAK